MIHRHLWLCAAATIAFAELALADYGGRALQGLTESESFQRLATAMGGGFPVIENVKYVTDRSLEASTYVALTLLLLPVKIWLMSVWIRRPSMARHWIVTPFNRISYSVAESLLDHEGNPAPKGSTNSSFRAWFRTIAFILVGLLVTTALLFLFAGEGLRHGEHQASLLNRQMAAFSAGGFQLWALWSVTMVWVASFAAASAMLSIYDSFRRVTSIGRKGE